MIPDAVFGSLIGALGVIPFIHTNLILQFLQNFYTLPKQLAIFSISTAVSHAFFEILPTLFLIFPQNRLEMGRKTLGSILIIGAYSMVLSVILLPVAVFALPALYSQFKGQLKYLLLAIISSNLVFQKTQSKVTASVFIFLLSGLLGFILFLRPSVPQPLFPLLSGLFAFPALFFKEEDSPKESLPNFVPDLKLLLYCCSFCAVSTLFPALTIGAILGILSFSVKDERNLPQVIICLGVSKVFYDISASVITGKTRSLAAVLAHPLSVYAGNFPLLIISAVSILSASIACAILLLLPEKLISPVKLFENAKFKQIFFASVLTFICLTSGISGIILSFCAFCLGAAAKQLSIRKSYLMGCLIVPSIAYSFGFDQAIAGSLNF